MKKKLVLYVLAIMILADPLTSFATSFTPLIVPGNSTPVSAVPSDVLKKAIADYRNLPRSERRSRIKEVKKAIHEYKVAKKANAEPSTNTLLLVILSLLIPPLAVYLHQGEINNKFWISLVLTILGFLPGVIYALVVVLGKSS